MNDREYSDVRTAVVDRSLGRSLDVFSKIAGKWLFGVWILTALAGFLSFALMITNIKQISPALWGTLIFVGFVVAPIAASHYLRIQRDEFKALWDSKAAEFTILSQIEEARAEAVELNIEGMALSNEEHLTQWAEKVNTWRSSTYEKVSQLHPAEAGNFDKLGVFTVELARGTQLLNTEHERQLTMLVRRIRILSEIRDRWTTRRA